jgi:hypothetical protein
MCLRLKCQEITKCLLKGTVHETFALERDQKQFSLLNLKSKNTQSHEKSSYKIPLILKKTLKGQLRSA